MCLVVVITKRQKHSGPSENKIDHWESEPFLLEFRSTVIKSVSLIQFGFAVLGFIDGNVGAECTELWDSKKCVYLTYVFLSQR